jgi:hypothetical protein
MTRYLISFDQGAMDHIPDEEGPAVGKAAHAVSQEAMDAGMIVDVPSRKQALEWAAKIAVACRCAQECHEILPDPAVGN